MAMLDKVKLALRISHTALDSDITDTIKTARLELIRAGVLVEKANSEDDELIDMALKTYCLYVYCNNDKIKDKYLESWQYQLDNIRKSDGYMRLGV